MTLWEAQPGRWWPAVPVLYGAGGVGLTVLLADLTRLDPWSLLALLFVAYGVRSVVPARARVRLTPDGVEVRGLRTTLHPYADIASVQVAPEWDDGRSVWLRRRGSLPHADPEVLTPPLGWEQASGRTTGDVVAQIRAEIDARTDGG